MGISGLLPLLKEISVNGNIKEFAGKRLAVDAYVWLHKGAFGCAEDLVKGKKTTKFVDYAMYRVRLLKHHGITPYIVFDGGPLPAKMGTEVSRAKSRAENLARATSLESQGRQKEARDYYTKCVDITPEMAYQLIKALRAENIEYVVAPYEADAQLYYLEREGYVDGIITEDSDLLVFGCKQVIFKLDGDGNCVHIHRDKLATISQFPMHGWTNTQFRRMAMLSGCDYLPSIPGIGLKKAHAALRRYKTVEKVLMQMRLEGAHKIPDNYIEAFNQAELAFMHQRVYCPKEMRLRPINDFPEAGLGAEDERWIGLDVTIEIAQGMATGDIHPETRIPIVDEWPDYTPGSRTAHAPVTNVLKESSKVNIAPAKTGPMDAFVSRKKVILPKPVGTNTSGPSRLSDLSNGHPSPPSKSNSAPAASRHSKFFSGGSLTAAPSAVAGPSTNRQFTKWPSGEGVPAEHDKLIWEPSDEAGPDVDIESPFRPSIVKPVSAVLVGGAQSSPIRSPSPMISTLRHQSSPTSRVARIGQSPGAHSDGPDISSPVNMTSPPSRQLVKKESILSSPPDIAADIDVRVRRPRSEDPFSPIPSPVTIAMGTEGREGYRLNGASRSVTPTLRISSAPDLSQTPTRKGKERDLGIGRMVPASAMPGQRERLRAAKVELGIGLGSSDSIEEDEEVITPSYDMGRGQEKRSRDSGVGLGGGRGLKGGEVEEEDVVMVDDDDDDEEEVRRKVEEERRADKAKTVALGWRSKFALNGGAGSLSSPRIPESTLKRRRTDSAIHTKPSAGPSTPISSSFPTPRTQGETQSRSTRDKPTQLPIVNTITPTISKVPTKAIPKSRSAFQVDTSQSSSSRTAVQSRPLSAFAPRILTVKSLNEVSIPISPEKVRLDRAERAVRPSAGKAVRAESVDGSEGDERDISKKPVIEVSRVLSPVKKARTGGLSRFMFSGEVVRTREVL